MLLQMYSLIFFFVKQKTAYEMRISDWSSDVCSSDLEHRRQRRADDPGADHGPGRGPGRSAGADGRIRRVIGGTHRPPARPDRRTEQDNHSPAMIKVASYTMRTGIGLDRRRDPARVLAVLGELDADIVALQEADRRFGARARAIPPHMFAEHTAYVPDDLRAGRPDAIGWHGNALLVRKGAEIAESHEIGTASCRGRGCQDG